VSAARLQDDRGCLTEAGVRALARAPVGEAPADLVAHVASCDRCQKRVLAKDTGPAQSRREPPPMWRTMVVLGLALLLALLALGLAAWLRGAE
jgi:hypothetical protein